MHLLRVTIVGATLLASVLHAQTLQHRSPANPDPPAPTASTGDGPEALPLAGEGEYRWGEPGEVIELYVENGALRGYMTRRSERDHAGSAPMTFAFAQAGIAGDTLSFRTRRIHGDWYSFKGRVIRGPAASRSLEGYYLLQGTLSLHLGAAEPGDQSASGQSLTRQVSLKLAAGKHAAE